MSYERICWICGKLISLESCKTDDHGHPVHENCYVAKIARRPPQTQKLPPNKKRSHLQWNDVT